MKTKLRKSTRRSATCQRRQALRRLHSMQKLRRILKCRLHNVWQHEVHFNNTESENLPSETLASTPAGTAMPAA